MPTADLPLFFVVDAHAAAATLGSEGLSQRLQSSGRAHGLHLVREPDALPGVVGVALNAAREARGALVALGCPRTVNTVLQAAWNAQLPFGVLATDDADRPPAARADPERALDALLGARLVTRPLGWVADRVFMRCARLGLRLPAAGAHAATSWGDDLSALLGARSLMTLQLRERGELRVLRTRSVEVHAPAPTDHAADAQLRVATVPALPPLASAVQLLRSALPGRRERGGSVDVFDAAQVHVAAGHARRAHALWRGEHGVRLVLDDEALEWPLPLDFRLAPRPLHWLNPARRAPG